MNRQEAIYWMLRNPSKQVYTEGYKPWRYVDGQFEHQDTVSGEWCRCDPLINMSSSIVYKVVEIRQERWQWAVQLNDGSVSIVTEHFSEKEARNYLCHETILGKINNSLKITLS